MPLDDQRITGQLEAGTRDVDTNRRPEFAFTVSVFSDGIVETSDGPKGNITIGYVPVERVTANSPEVINRNPSDFDIWTAAHYLQEVLATFSPEVKQKVQQMAATMRKRAVDKRVGQMAKEDVNFARALDSAEKTGQIVDMRAQQILDSQRGSRKRR